MIPCSGSFDKKWWMHVLCYFGVHWHGRTDGGAMGDATQCFICGLDQYSALGEWVVNDHKAGHKLPPHTLVITSRVFNIGGRMLLAAVTLGLFVRFAWGFLV